MIIGHRGAADVAPENTIEAMRAGIEAGANMLEFDIRLTKDDVAVVIHDPSLLRTHHRRGAIRQMTLAELKEKTKDQPVPTLREVLDTFFGKITLNIECKSKGSGAIAVELVKEYIKKESDWHHVLFSSFHIKELQAIRSLSKSAPLALLHTINPLRFTAYDSLLLTAVGFFTPTATSVVIAAAKKRRLMTYVYMVNKPSQIARLEKRGVEAIVTNNPGLFKT